MRAVEFITESLNQPYKMKWEKSEYGSMDALVKLPDGTYLSIMFNQEVDRDDPNNVEWVVEFYRNNSQEVTGEGDQQRIFATVLEAIRKFVKKVKPKTISFSAAKNEEPGTKVYSRANLYNKLVQRYAGTMGYQVRSEDLGDIVFFTLVRSNQGVAEGESTKSGIVQTEVYGTKAYHAKCMEPNCDWQSKRYDRINQAQMAAKKHAEQHVGNKAVTENQIGKARGYLWHGSKNKISVLTPRQATDTGGAEGSNRNAIYATPDKNTAIKMGMAERGSDTAMFNQNDQLVLFSGKLRHGKMVYLHQLPLTDKEGNNLWEPGGNDNEFTSVPGVKEIRPLKIIPVPVDSHLDLVRKPTRKDLQLRQHYLNQAKQKQGVSEETEKKQDPITNAAIDFYRHVGDIKKEPVDNYVSTAKEMLNQVDDPTLKSKLVGIFRQANKNPYVQGGVVTTIGALLAGGVLSSAQKMGLNPAQTNLLLQSILNTVIPTVVSRINGKNWTDTIKYTIASAGIGTGIAGIMEAPRGLAPTKPYDDVLANMGYFMSLNTVKIQQDAVDETARQELELMQQNFRKPILNGMNFFDAVKMSKNPKVAPILLKYVYDMLGYIEPRIKKYIKPDQQQKYLDRLDQIKSDYRGAVAQVS